MCTYCCVLVCTIIAIFIIGDTRSVQWTSDSLVITSPTMKECSEVMSQLKRQQQRRWKIYIMSSSNDSLLIVLNNINECLVSRLVVENTPLDSRCVTKLSDVLRFNKTIEELWLRFSPLISIGLEMVTNAVSANATLKILWMTGDDYITDEDVPHICHMINVNTTLEEVYLICPNITTVGLQQVSGIIEDNTLTELIINGNCFFKGHSPDFDFF